MRQTRLVILELCKKLSDGYARFRFFVFHALNIRPNHYVCQGDNSVFLRWIQFTPQHQTKNETLAFHLLTPTWPNRIHCLIIVHCAARKSGLVRPFSSIRSVDRFSTAITRRSRSDAYRKRPFSLIKTRFFLGAWLLTRFNAPIHNNY
jgi:hypothetical protein